jgi:hypothetical protein
MRDRLVKLVQWASAGVRAGIRSTLNSGGATSLIPSGNHEVRSGGRG